MNRRPPLESLGPYDLLSIADASSYLRVSEPTVRDLVRQGRLRSVPIGRKLFFTKMHLIDFISPEGSSDEPSL
ncbi:MAG: helix-turn-helix domain-containing protein [Mesorhizobium sp.]